jgi:FAD/FMN-containing dehydrogenase
VSLVNNDFTETRTDLNHAAISRLRADAKGRVITPEDADYDEARLGLSLEAVRRPALIVRPVNAFDVSFAVSLARETGAELAIRGGGHSLAGHSTVEGGIVIDMSHMKRLDFDIEGRTAWAEAGLTAGEYTNAAAEHGLATGFGDAPTVGISGLTTGGGIGYLVRKYGLTIDNLLAAEVVTADGMIRHVDAETHSDLFWAIRGGGGNFGVVTRFQYQLQPVDTIVGGVLILPATAEVLAAFVAAADAAPDELSVILNIMPAPPLPFIPAEYHGQIVIMAMMVTTGDIEEGMRIVAPFRELAEPIVDMIGPMPYPRIYLPEDPNFRPVSSLRSKFIETIDVRMAQTILDHVQAGSAVMSIAQIRVLGGAMARVPADATAFAHRSGRILASFIALYMSRDEDPTHLAWVTNAMNALEQGQGEVYVNFVGDEGKARVHDAYPNATRERLAEIKARYDPANLFHRNQNIAPKNQ